MDTLIIIQTVFYFLASIVMVAVGLLIIIILYYLVGIMRNTRNLSDDISKTFTKTKTHIKKIINSFSGNNKHEKNK